MWGLRKERSHEDRCRKSDGQRNIRVADGAGKLTAWFFFVSSFAPAAQVWAPAWTTSRQSRSSCTPPQRQVRPTMQTNSAAFSTASGLDSANTRWVYFLIFRSTFTEFVNIQIFSYSIFSEKIHGQTFKRCLSFLLFLPLERKKISCSCVEKLYIPSNLLWVMSTEVGFDLHC